MRNWWLIISCFITGFNYELISVSSWMSKAIVLKNMSAMLTICLNWALIGYVFGMRYLKLEVFGCLLISVSLIFIVIQVERQILMSISKKPFLFIFRSVIGFVMAFLGALILDQVIFSTDIAHKKLEIMDDQVVLLTNNQASRDSVKCKLLDIQIQETLGKRDLLLNDITKRPVLKLIDSDFKQGTENISNVPKINSDKITSIQTRTIVNPNIELLNNLYIELERLRQEKKELLMQQKTKVNEYKSSLLSESGFTEELGILFLIFKENKFALIVWICLTLMFFAMELLIMANKIGEPRTDYDKSIERELKENINKIDYQDDSMIL
ncbi:MAG: DUF4407 domain-containing protein [Bacteroidales bacterium]|nr:DUF4407 domain-containing protein [Bacteroidales bacterium]